MSVIPAAAAAVLTISFLILSMTSRAVLSQLTTDDFYIDPSPTVLGTVSGTNIVIGPSVLPSQITITNLKISTIENFSVGTYLFGKGVLRLSPSISSSSSVYYNILRVSSFSVLTEGEATLSVSTDAVLLTRALNDITAVYGSVAVTPTHLLIFTNTDIRASASTQGTTFQLVIAISTNGQYSYGILQFVSIEPAAATRGDIADLELFTSGTITATTTQLPYATNVLQATTLSNTGTGGKYVLDFNKVPPCNCKKRFLLVACEALKQQNTDNIPRLCTE